MHPIRINGERPFLVLILISLLALALVAATVATLSAGVNGPDEDILLPIIRVSGTPVIPVSTTGSLQDGGLMTGLDGVMVGAITGTISTTLQITISRAGTTTIPLSRAAATAIPLDSGLTPLGNRYDIAASRDYYAPSGHPFMIALPVAPLTDTSHLAMAVLLPADRLTDGTVPDWFTFRGVYHAGKQMFLAAIGGLSKGGYQVVLVDAPNQTTLPPVNSAHARLQKQVKNFVVQCATGFPQSQPCGPAEEAAAANQLLYAYNDVQGTLSFNDPLLMERRFWLDPFGIFVTPEYYNIYLTTSLNTNCDVEGEFVADVNFEICIKAGKSITDHRNVIRHEYFHATQHGYSTVHDASRDAWIMEGTATAAEYSFQTMTRTLDYELRPVDIPLPSAPKGEVRQYEAQDFWVYAGLKNNQGLGYLHPLFEKGARTEHVVEVLGDGTHLPIYWDWVKNQVLEKVETFDGALTDPCSLTPEVVTSIHPWNFDHTTSLAHPVGQLEPLNTIVVGVIWDGKYDIADGSVLPAGGFGDTEALQALRYKMYREGETGCEGVADGRRLFDKKDGEISSANFYWVLISNIHPTKSFPYTIFFEVAPLPPN